MAATSVRAQALPTGRTGRVIDFSESFDGSASPSGAFLRMSTDVGVDLTRKLGLDVVLPIYFVIPPVQQTGYSPSTPSLGSLAIDERMSFDLPAVEYRPTVTIAFPTGSTAKGFSTGTVTYDLDNHFAHDFGFVAPFLDVDVGNSLNNGTGPFRSKVQMPYLTLGNLAEVKAGPEIQIMDHLTVSGDGYDVLPWGPQTVFSRTLWPGWMAADGTHNRIYEVAARTDGGPGLVKDYGFDASVHYIPARFLDLYFLDLTLGYSRSVHYDLNTLSLSLGINISQMLSRRSQ